MASIPPFDPNAPFEEIDGDAPAQPTARPFRDEDFPEYTRLVTTRGTTPAQLVSWLEERGYGTSQNAAEVLTFHRRHPNIRPVNTYRVGQASTPAPNGDPQPGSPTDWLPDFIQDPIEHLALQLGFIDPGTYYGRGNYGANARRPNQTPSASAPPLPTWTQRAIRTAGEMATDAGSGVNAYILRGMRDVGDDEAIRSWGSNHRLTPQQIDAMLAENQRGRSSLVEEERLQRSIRDNDEVARSEGLGLDENGVARSSWGGWAARGSADLAGALVGDANPSYLIAPEVAPVANALSRAAPAVGRAVAPIVERALTAVAPTAGRMVGQGGVQGAIDAGLQGDEIDRGLRDNFDIGEVGTHAVVGALAQGALEGVIGASRIPGRMAAARRADAEAEVAATEALRTAGIDPETIPPGTTPREIVSTLEGSRGLADEAVAFRGRRDPSPEELFREPMAQNDAAALEASLRAEAGDRISPTTPEPVSETAPAPDRGISKRQANELLREELNTRPVETQTPTQWGRDLQSQADEFLAVRQAETPPLSPEVTRPIEAVETATPATPTPEAQAPVDASPSAAPVATDVVTRLTNALRTAGKATAEQAELYRVERAHRFAKVREARAAGGGREAYRKALAAMKGEYKKANFASVQDQFSGEEIASLFDHISQSNLSDGQATAAHAGLDRILTGRIPQPAQLGLLSDIFGGDFVKATLRNRTALRKAGSTLEKIWNTPKSLQSTADLSAPLRQGIGLVHREEWRQSFKPMIEAMVNPAVAARYEAAILQHPNYDLATEAGLSLTTSKEGGVHEDFFNGNYAEDIPVWGRVVRGSERAYVTFLNKLRFDTFNSLLEDAVRLGHSADNPEVGRGIANYINIMTGRGSLGGLERVANTLNNVFYSARMISSRLRILTAPAQALFGRGFIAELPRGMRMEAAKSYAGIIGANATLLSLAAMAGLSVSLDPLSSDFLKAKDGNTRIDLGGGLTQYIVAGARALMRQRTTSGENGTTSDLEGRGNTALDNDLRFLMNKLHPSLTLILDQQRGTDTVGETFTWQTAILDRITPMGIPDIVQTLREHGTNPGGFYAVLALLGASLSNYQSGNDPVPAGTEAVTPTEPAANAPAFNPDAPFEEIPAETTRDSFDPNAPFEETTQSNLVAQSTLESLGVTITDSGVRSHADQASYAATTNGVAAPGRSLHEEGNAIDIRVPQDLTEDDIVSELENAGFEGVRIITKRHGTGPHWHIQWSALRE